MEKRNYYSIQALRGIFALCIVAFHTLIMVRERLDVDVGRFGGAGAVDMFFVISGFMMVLTTHALWGKAHVAWPFLKRRLIRIVPLYWMATTLKLAILVAGGAATLTSWHTVASYLFIPAWNSKHEVFPILIPGGTLSVEVFFYLLMAGCLFLKKQPLVPVTVIMGVLALVGLAFRPFEAAWLRLVDPQLVELVLGMWIGKWTLEGRKLPIPLACALMLGCIAVIAATNSLPTAIIGQYRAIIWGVPAALLLAAVVALENSKMWQMPLLQFLGQASFSIYLIHDFVISAVRVYVQSMGFRGEDATIHAVLWALLASAIAGDIVHRRIEKPMTRWLQDAWDSTSPRLYIYQRKPVKSSLRRYFSVAPV